MTAWQWAFGLAELIGAGVAVDWLLFRHQRKLTTEEARAKRYRDAAQGIAKMFRCTECGKRCRDHIWNPSWDNPLPHDVALCSNCIDTVDDRNKWMGFDIVYR